MSKKFVYLTVFVVLLGLGAEPAIATDYYVAQNDPNADDLNPGTEALPWETLLKACQTVVAGDTVYVKEGTYIDTVNSFERKFKPTNTGTAENPITFISSPQLAAVVRSDSLPSSRSDYAWGLSWGSQYIIIDGFKIEGGIVLGYDGCDHCTIRNCELIYGRCPDSDPSLNWGIALHHANDCMVENNYVHSMTDSGNNAHNTACIMMFGNCDRTIIQGNTADASGGIVYNAFGQKAGQMNDNIWRYNLALNATAGFLGMASTDETRPTEDNTYYQNIAINCDNAFFLSHMAYRFVIYNNTAVDCDKFLTASKNTNIDTQLWNNILVGTNYRAIWWGGYPEAMPFSTLIDYSNYNCFYNNSMIAFREKSPSLYYYTLNDWQTGTGFDMNSIVDDPCLVGGGDYHLQSSSPCIDAGIDLQDYDDDQNTTESINMGAYITGDETIGHDWGATSPPDQAANPNPADSATDVSIDADLSWTAGSGATSHDVYFGTTSPGTFQGNQAATTFEPGTMLFNTTYYWRIDEINNYGTTTGTVWSFTTAASVYDVADSDIPVAGTVTGSYTDTQSSDDVYESIEEIESGGKPTNRYTYLEHKWTIDVAGGTTVTFYVEAYHTSNTEGDDFVFAYSTNDSDYTNMVTVTKISDDHTAQSYELPGDTSGTVYIRVKDADQTPGNRTKDTIYVDDMYIESQGGEPTPGVTIIESGGSTDVDEEGPTSDTYTVVLDTLPTDTVTITVDPDIETEVNSNGAGNPVNLTFLTTNWDTPQTVTVTAIDDGDMENDHTSTITHTAVSNDIDYDGISIASVVANVTDNDCDSVTAHVESIVCDTVAGTQGKKYGRATVTIYDNCGNPVSGADVDGTFTGDYEETFYDQTTDGSGVAVFVTTTQVKKPSFTFCVDDVTHATLTYDPNDNVLTCNSN